MKNKMKRMVIVFWMMVFVVMGAGVAKSQGWDQERAFDAKFYMAKYPDLCAAYQGNAANALWHWENFGFSEGRQSSPTFDVQYYLNRYPDLQQAFGNNYQAASWHWYFMGINEGRRGSREFDSGFYLANNPDVNAACSGDRACAINHWVTYGISEGRRGAADYNYPANQYLPCANPATVQATKKGFEEAFINATLSQYEEIDGPRYDNWGDGAISVENHINGMAVVDGGANEWFVVNYPNYWRDKGRLLFWNRTTGNWAPVHYFSMGGKDGSEATGFPACMQSDGNYLVVGTGDSSYLKVFDFSSPQNGVRELTQLELKLDGVYLENVGLAYHPGLGRYVLFADKNKFWLSKNNVGRDLSKADGWESVTFSGSNIPFGEAGTALLHISGNLFAVLSLGAQLDITPYSYQLSYVELSQNGGQFSVSTQVSPISWFFFKQGEGGGAPSFRWGGTAKLKQSQNRLTLDIYAAPKRLDASGNYYKWSGSGTVK